MHYNFLFNGCSFTAGAELEGPNKDLEHRITHRFSHLVAEHYNKTYDNISQSGVSNDWIIESTVGWFEEGNTCDVAVIQFTDKSRTIWYDQNNKTRHNFGIRKSKTYLHYNLNSLYYKLFYSEILGTQNYYKNLFFMSQYLKNKSIKKIIFLTINRNLPEDIFGWARYYKEPKIKSVSDLIGISGNKNLSIIDNENYCRFYGHNTITGGHPSEIGHQKIAQYIIDTIGTFQ